MLVSLGSKEFSDLMGFWGKLTLSCKNPYPFTAKRKRIMERCKKNPRAWRNMVIYDDKAPANISAPWKGYTAYSMVQEISINKKHIEIAEMYKNVFVCIPHDKLRPYLIVVPEYIGNSVGKYYVANSGGVWHNILICDEERFAFRGHCLMMWKSFLMKRIPLPFPHR